MTTAIKRVNAYRSTCFLYRACPAIGHPLNQKILIIQGVSNDAVIYLDNNATTPVALPVLEAMIACARCQHANPASHHRLGQRARQVVEQSRERLLIALGGNLAGHTPDQFVFTSGATEANNWVLRKLCGEGPLVCSAIEHPSISRTGHLLQQEGVDVCWLNVDHNGLVCLDQLELFLRRGPKLVSIIWANHETGVIQPMNEIDRLCRHYGVPLHTDATQIFAKQKIDFRQYNISAITVSAHKFHGPGGIGGLWIRGDVPLNPLLYGGLQQGGLRAGTESPILVEGLKAAEEWSLRQPEMGEYSLVAMRDRLEERIKEAVPDVVIHGGAVTRAPQTTCFSLPGINRQALLMSLDQAGIACSTGAACESGTPQRSPTLEAMGCKPHQIETAIRLSVGRLNTPDEIEEAVSRILLSFNTLQRISSREPVGMPARRGGPKMVD